MNRMSIDYPPTLTGGLALFLDFDGTLAPLQDDPDSVGISNIQTSRLLEINDMMSGALALVSGRDVRDLSKRVPNSLWRAGNHGLYICEPDQTAPAELPPAPSSLVEKVQTLADDTAGTRLEVKGKVLALHYRAAPEAEDELVTRAAEILSNYDEYKLQNGKFVLEAKPKGAHKGAAVEALLERPPFAGRTPVMVGDDKTDEDAIEVVVAKGGWAVKVGEGATSAQYRLSDTEAVWSWLSRG